MTGSAPLPAPLDEGRVRARIALLPTLPPLVMELLGSFQQEDLNVTALAERIGNEQTLAARVLRIANSPFYGLSGRVASIHDAVVILGFRAVRSLVLAAAMVGAFPTNWAATSVPPPLSGVTPRGHRPGGPGCPALPGENPETAFQRRAAPRSGPGFHGRGLVRPFRRSDALADGTRSAPTGRRNSGCRLDSRHGGTPFGRTMRPTRPLGEAIARHHEPDREPTSPLVDLVHGADLIALALELDGRENSAVPPPSPGAWARLGLDQASLISLFGEVDENFQETCHALLP